MEFDQKLVNEIFELNSSLYSLGLNEEFMEKSLKGVNSKISLDAVVRLFNIVHMDTQYGNMVLPALPLSPSIGIVYNRAIQKFYLTEDGEINPIMEKAIMKYSSDSQFRIELYVLYNKFVLPTIRNQRVI